MNELYHQIGKKKTFTAVLIVLMLMFSVVGFVLPVFGNGSVVPSTVEETLYPGESVTVEKTVTNPLIPPKLDLLLLEDETGSFIDDIDEMQGEEPDSSDGLAAELWDDIALEVDDFQAAVAGFRDFAQDGWGSSVDWVYKLHQDMTNDKTTWLTGISALSAGGGADGPEAQLAALKSGADGHAWDSNQDGDLLDSIDTPAGEDPNWRDEATKVIVLVTDATYHVWGDEEYPDDPLVDMDWPGPTYADAISELNAEGIHVIVLTTSASLVTFYNGLATATDGTVKLISDDSSDIVDAVLDALEEILTDVWWEVEGDPELDVSLTPDVHYDVTGGSVLSFTETISVANDVEPGTYSCTVTFYANEYPEEGAEIGEQTITVTVESIPVDIDIKPGSYPNSINRKNKKGVIAVAVFTTDDFDVSSIDHSTVTFAGADPAHKNNCAHMEDVDGDGDLDVVYHFNTQDTNIEFGDTEACLSGKLLDLRAFVGCDSVRVLK